LRNHSPERFSMSTLLQEVVGSYIVGVASTLLSKDEGFTKHDILMCVWQYIKEHNLVKEDDPGVIINDALLQKVRQDIQSKLFHFLLVRY